MATEEVLWLRSNRHQHIDHTLPLTAEMDDTTTHAQHAFTPLDRETGVVDEQAKAKVSYRLCDK